MGTKSSNRDIMIVLSYLGILAVIPLVVEKDDEEVKWHAKHGLVIFVAFIICAVFLNILAWVVPSEVSCFFGCVPWLVLMAASLIVAVLGIMKGLKGERLIIPGLSDFANRF